MKNYLVLRQDESGNLYGRPKVVSTDPLATTREVLEKAFGHVDGPRDRRLARAMVFPISDVEDPVSIPVKVSMPVWASSESWVPVVVSKGEVV